MQKVDRKTHRERKYRRQFLLAAAFAKRVVDQFDKAVDLFVFVVLRFDDFEIFRKHTEVHERRDIFALAQQILLFAVVRLWRFGSIGGRPLFAAHAPGADRILDIGTRRRKQKLAVLHGAGCFRPRAP